MNREEKQGNSTTREELIEAAKALLADGINPIPIKPEADGTPSKGPTTPGWQKRKLTVDDLAEAFDDGDNIGGQFESNLLDTDLDCHEAVDLVPHFLPATPFRFGRPSKRYPHLVYSVPGYKGANQKFTEPKKNPSDRNEKEKMLVEIRHGSCQTVMPPSIYPADASAPEERSSRIPHASGPVPELNVKDYERRVKRLAAATLISRNLPTGSRHFFWLFLGGAMARSGWSRDEALHFHHAIIQTAPNFGNHDADINDSFEKFANNQPVAGLDKLDEIVGSAITNKLVKWLALQDAAADESQINDVTNLRFIMSHHRESLSHCPGEGWYRLQSDRWRHSDEGIISDIVRQELEKRYEEIARQLSSRFSGDDLRKRLNKLEQLLYFNQHGRLTKALGNHPEVRVEVGTFDTDGWLLGTQNGIYDFRERRLLPGSRELLVSRLVPHNYVSSGPPPRRWLTYLERVQPEPEYRKLLQQIAGSCLLGLIIEKSLYFFYGPKAGNGKSLFARVLLGLMGRDYGKPIHPDLVFQSEFASGATDYHVAALQNARLLYCPEDQKNRPWNVGFLNSLIGGADPIICRPIREAPLTFFSQAKLIVPSSKKPVLESVDEGFRRRFLLIKWNQKLPDEGEALPVNCQDEEVILRCMRSGAKIQPDTMIRLLLEEAEGILRWAIAGAHALIDNGFRLELPEKVVTDTNTYLADEDWIANFVRERLEVLALPEGMEHPEQIRKFVLANGTEDRVLLSSLQAFADNRRMFDQRTLNSYLEDVDGVHSAKGHANRRRFNIRVLASEENKAATVTVSTASGPF
jgi:phage/plasmid-associated DNA primase